MAIENRGPVQIFGTAAGFAPVRNLIAIGDPNVHKFGDRWWMFVGAAHTGGRVNLFSASLPPGAPLSSDAWTITTEAGDPTRAAPLVEHPEPGRWDEFLHTPSYARGPAGDETGICGRIYFTGSQSVSEEERSFSIGVLERSGQGWRRREEPVLQGRGNRANVLEPKVLWSQGRWRMWVMATAKEAGPDDLPDYQIHYLESADGMVAGASHRCSSTSATTTSTPSRSRRAPRARWSSRALRTCSVLRGSPHRACGGCLRPGPPATARTGVRGPSSCSTPTAAPAGTRAGPMGPRSPTATPPATRRGTTSRTDGTVAPDDRFRRNSIVLPSRPLAIAPEQTLASA